MDIYRAAKRGGKYAVSAVLLLFFNKSSGRLKKESILLVKFS